MFEKLKNGYVTEEKFAMCCLEKDIPISRPLYNTEPYDFIVEVNGAFRSVQVKKSWKDQKNRNVVCVRTSYPRSNKRTFVGAHDNVDYLAVLTEDNDWYILPKEMISHVKVNLSVSKKGKYKRYCNNWDFEQ